MGVYFRKRLRMGPLRFNLSKRGVGMSVGVKGLRIGTRAGRRGTYVSGGRQGVYFRERVK